MKEIALLLMLLGGILITQNTNAQPKFNGTDNPPKLVVGIVVEDMRPDYIDRYWHKFRDDGFRHLIKYGFTCRNHHINNLIQRNSVGMATLQTGTAPSQHGIINDQWIDRLKKKEVDCLSDPYYTTIGSDSEQGAVSALKLLTSTLGDELKIYSNQKSKIYSVALNPSAAVFAAGHAGDGAYWLDTENGNMISSSYYQETFPQWAFDFNAKKMAEAYIQREWNTLLPLSDYIESTEDGYILEPGYLNKWNTFPYSIEKIKKNNQNFQILKSTPFGNTLVRDFASSIIENEALGQDDYPDMLTVVFSSMDYERYSFGPASVEMEDTYLRMDREIAILLKNIDQKIGLENVLIYLTATSSSSYPSYYLKEEFKMDVGVFNPERAVALLKAYLNITFGPQNWIETYMNQQVYLNHDLISKENIDLKTIQAEAAAFINQFEGVSYAKPAFELETANLLGSPLEPFQNSYHVKRSGDVLLRFEEGWQPKEKYKRIDYTENHHVPLIWYGGQIHQGKLYRRTDATDIVPTIADILGISKPNASTGHIMNELKK